jgi:hypothetical protein
MKGFIKDPDATLDYSFDWGPWLGGTDTVISSTWTVESGLSIVPASEAFDDTTTTVFITGGAVGENYTLKNTITTNGSRTDERSIEIKIRNR